MTPVERLLTAAAAAARESGEPSAVEGVAHEAARFGAPALARELLAEIEDKLDESWWFASLATVHGMLGDAKQVVRLHRTAEKRWKKEGGDPEAFAYHRSQLVLAYEHVGNVEQADAVLGDTQELLDLANLVEVAAQAGRLARAEALARRAQVHVNPPYQASMAVDVARAAHRSGETARGLAWLDKAVEATKGIERGDSRGEVLAELALAYAELGAKARAGEVARLAHASVGRHKDPYGLPWHLVLVKALRAGGVVETAKRVLDGWDRSTAQTVGASGYAFAAAALAGAGELERARFRLSQAESRREGGQDAEALARAHVALGDVDAALEAAARVSDPEQRANLLRELVQLAAQPAGC